MKKTELIAKVAQATGLTKKDVNKVIDEAIKAIEEALKNGEKVSFIGFGSFEVVKRAPREARVPGTNKVVKIPETKSVKFKVGKKLKELVNSK
jgi:DNA-binding protein HU-beta